MDNKQQLQDSDRIDWKVISELRSLDGALADILGIFESELPQKLESIQKALNEKNSTEAVKAAHSLRSSSSYLGALKIKQLCDEIRTQVEQNIWSELDSVHSRLKEECQILLTLLRDLQK